jgi:ribose transport system substrate-binding protein
MLAGKKVSLGGPLIMKSLIRACQILRVFRDESECLRLSDVVVRTGLNKTTVLRILDTLTACELLTRVGGTKYRLGIRTLGKKRYRFGYGMQGAQFSFSRAVTESLQRSAAAADIDLFVLDNQDSPSTALQNADVFVRERIDLVIESQTDTRIGGQISERFRAASIPIVALEIPHPQTIFYGANNSQAGLIAGRHLARWAESQWQGNVDELLLLELPRAGQVPNARILGSLLGVIERLVWLSQSQIKILHTNGHYENAHTLTRLHLRRSRSQRILVAAINDPCALGALQAFRDAGREEHCAIVGHNASSEVHSELANKGTRLIGSVGYFPERYGEGVIPLALDLLSGRPVPSATFVRHEMVTPSNLRSFYPSNQLVNPPVAATTPRV